MGRDFVNLVAKEDAKILLVLVLVSAAGGALVYWGLPKAWMFLKPLIHQWTA